MLIISADIELHFSDNSRPITDRKIAMAKHAKKNQLEHGNADKICTVSMVTAKAIDNRTNAGVDNRGFEL